MKKTARTSADVPNENLQKLRAVFPQFVKDGVVDFAALKAFFDKEAIAAGPEKYGLSWAGKNDAIRALQTPATGTLVPQEKEGKDWDTTQNIFIEGDNLEVLKLLQKQYGNPGQIKMIYIDPPYNTGKDFIYKDNFTEGLSDYYERTGQSKDGIKLTANLESNGRYHSDWLTMLYPRLFLAKNLLRDDGVIFVSIDDHEVANLRLIMDEIFGRENFRNTITVSKIKKNIQENETVQSLNQGVGYILCYSRSESTTFVPPTKYQKKEERWHAFDAPGIRITMQYELLGHRPPTGRHWMYEEGRAKEMVATGDLRLSPTSGKPQYRLSASDRTNLDTNWTDLVESDSTWIKNGGKNPKIIRRMLEFINDRSAQVLDFFAGSGTTAEAVMTQNSEDKGRRSWVCVQLPEALDSEIDEEKEMFDFLVSLGKPTNIAELCKERIRRAGKQIEEERTEERTLPRSFLQNEIGYSDRDIGELESDAIGDLDAGFKAFSLQQSNYRQWNMLTEKDDAKKLLAQEKLFLEKPLVDDYDERAVVYEILLKEGFSLNVKVKQDSRPLKPWIAKDEERKLIVTFAKEVSKEQVEALGLSETDLFVCFDSALDDSTKVNLLKGLGLKVKVI